MGYGHVFSTQPVEEFNKTLQKKVANTMNHSLFFKCLRFSIVCGTVCIALMLCSYGVCNSCSKTYANGRGYL